MANFWTEITGKVLTTLEERVTTIYTLPVNNDYLPLSSNDLTITLISGDLPRGMRLENENIVGTPFEVSTDVLYTFVLRANQNGVIDDRTFSIIVTGADEPVWVTAPDLLPVGPNNTYYIIDSAPLDFQLEAFDPDTSAGDTLEYFIQEGKGELPPGITLTLDGRLQGVVEPILALEAASNTGHFDSNNYGNFPYDFGIRPDNGFDSFFYDVQIYDTSTPSKSPKKLNRFYQFIVSASDGESITERQFRIYVVGDDFLRADNTIMKVANGVFTADNTHLRNPIWLTPGDLGYRRANNYITLFLDVIDPNSSVGIITYSLKALNDDGSESQLPPGMTLDTSNGEIAGRVPYQPAVTIEYKFTIEALRTVPDADIVDLVTYTIDEVPAGSGSFNLNSLSPYSTQIVGRSFQYFGIAYEILSVVETIEGYDRVIINKALTKTIPEGYSLNFGKFEVASLEESSKEKTFTVKMLGEIDSVLTWTTASNLGIISSNYVSTLNVAATSTVPNANLLYTLVSGELPPGLFLSYDGEIIGKINSFGSVGNPGLTVFDNNNLLLDGATTSIDRQFTFTVKVQDHFGYSAITREFTVTVTDPDDKLYSNLFVKPFLKESQREDYELIISDNNLFDVDFIYRPNDPNFGIQKNMKMLVYAGIETKTAQYYVAASAKNHKRKRFKLGEIKTAIANTPGTQTTVYEVVYVEVIDPAENTKGKTRKSISVRNKDKRTVDSILLDPSNPSVDIVEPSGIIIGTRLYGDVTYYFYPNFYVGTRTGDVVTANSPIEVGQRDGFDVSINAKVIGTTEPYKFRPVPDNTLKVDSDAITIDETEKRKKYISNITNMRDNIRNIGETEINFLPLWMRTSQPGSIATLGYVKAIPLCYCKPGTSKEIATALKNANITFNQFDFDIDRYVIDTTEGNSQEQYLVFHNYDFNV